MTKPELKERLTDAITNLQTAKEQDERMYWEAVIDSLCWNLDRFHLSYKEAAL